MAVTGDAKLDPPGARKRAGLGQPGPNPDAQGPAPELAPRARMVTQTYIMDGTSQHIGDHRPDRCYLMVQNLGFQNLDVFLSFGQPQQIDSGYRIRPGGFYEPNIAPVSSIYIIGANNTPGERVTVVFGYDP